MCASLRKCCVALSFKNTLELLKDNTSFLSEIEEWCQKKFPFFVPKWFKKFLVYILIVLKEFFFLILEPLHIKNILFRLYTQIFLSGEIL